MLLRFHVFCDETLYFVAGRDGGEDFLNKIRRLTLIAKINRTILV